MSTQDDTTRRIAVVVMAYGTPRHRDELLAYYTDIRRGRPPTDEALADLAARYEAIGGLSPLAELTEAQRDTLQGSLDQSDPGRYEVVIGLKHAEPKIETTVAGLADRDLDGIVGLVLAPHYSAYSVGQYLDRLRAAAQPLGLPVVGIESWATEPAFVDFVAADLERRLATTEGHCRVLFTAHSLPVRIIETGDPYPDELRSTAEAVAQRVGLVEGESWEIAWQSAGRTPEPWIGPDVLDSIDQLAADGVDRVVVSSVGFVADHLEVLYDLDIEAAARAHGRGLAFDRTASVNDDPAVFGALAGRVRAAAAQLPERDDEGGTSSE